MRIISLTLAMAIGFVIVVSLRAEQPPAEAPIPAPIREAWNKANLQLGWMGIDAMQNHLAHRFLPEQLEVEDRLPGFHTGGKWKSGVIATLPAPEIPYGIAIHYSTFGNDDIKELVRLKNLKRLSLLMTNVNDDGCAVLATMQQLEEINLWDSKVTDAGLKHLAKLKNLKSLGLRGTKITDAGLKELVPLTQLNRLELGGNFSITDAGMTTIAKIKSLRALDVYLTNVTDVGVKTLMANKNWQSLHFVNMKITDAGIAQLAGQKEMRRLMLGGRPGFSEKVLPVVAGMKQLRYLSLNQIPVTEAGLKSLAGLTDLEHVGLYGAKIGDESVATLTAFKKVTFLDLRNTEITPRGVEKLKMAFPKANIFQP